MAYVPVIIMIICSFSGKLVNATEEFDSPETRCIGNATDFSSAMYQYYQVNVFSVVSSLTSESSPDSYLPSPPSYSQTIMGRNPHKAYGYYLCRGDIKPQLCHDCVVVASEAMSNQTRRRESYFPECFFFNDVCTLRYANHSIFSIYEEGRVLKAQGIGANVSDYQQYNRTLSNTVEELIREAKLGNWSKKFMTRVTEVPGSHDKIYTLVQCVPRISAMNCSKCLRELFSHLPTCCNGTQGGVVIHASCMMKYDSRSFFGGAYRGEGLSAALIGIIAAASATGAIILFSVGIWFCLHWRKQKNEPDGDIKDIRHVELLEFDLKTIKAATNNFSVGNILGQGGFGEVYRGKLKNGQIIAVKRLSTNSAQGSLEFKNEVLLVAKLQHRNLVKLLGFCISGRQRILIYEFLPNSSLDRFLDDPRKRASLDWALRFRIINGVAKGLQYLHEDSRLKIIHRDLKSSNILLDQAMNAKISDFGLARLFEVDQTQGDTEKVVGTYGYMAPEYAMAGQISVKSDIYSFGVIVLEVVSGQRNSIFHQQPDTEGLLHRAWRLWNEGAVLELIDPILGTNFPSEEVKLCIHIGLLCIQEDSNKRPRMTSIVAALNGQSITLPLPNTPHFFTISSNYDSLSWNPAKQVRSVSSAHTGTTSVTELSP